jgi:hypothetical protein
MVGEKLMKYNSKKVKKLKEKLIRYHEGDEEPLERVKKMERKRLTKLSRGGKVERSHKKRVGNIVNKNIEKRYNAALKALERIQSRKRK